MKKPEVNWNEDGWTTVTTANAVTHQLEVLCRCENGRVVEVRARHNDGEEVTGNVYCLGKGDEPVLPMSIRRFEKHFFKGELFMK